MGSGWSAARRCFAGCATGVAERCVAGVSSVACGCVELGHELTAGGSRGGEVLVAFGELELEVGGLLLEAGGLSVSGLAFGGGPPTPIRPGSSPPAPSPAPFPLAVPFAPPARRVRLR